MEQPGYGMAPQQQTVYPCPQGLFDPNTVIQAHTHRDTRTAIVVGGLWYFGYGPTNEQALVKGLPPGAFYTEPAGESHFARTGPEGATVAITGYGPTDTVYGK